MESSLLSSELIRFVFILFGCFWRGFKPCLSSMLALARELRDIIGIGDQSVPVDARSFSNSYRVCDLARCQGMCCYDGVFLEAPEVEVVERIVEEERHRFDLWGIKFDSGGLELRRKSNGCVQTKTATRSFDYEDQAEMPTHFDPTTCVFRCSDGRCSLQRLSVVLGYDPWHFKPMGCWMHPLELNLVGKPTVSVSSGGMSLFSGSTQCGKVCQPGVSGYETFRNELNALSVVLDQDLSQAPGS